ncbi:MAG: ROK family protein [Planctomycetota bacterium]|jgi:predicted NBD/HSP70 family sugar kinase|nr:ROK family protein [Planctomycetota bacterium]
MSVYYGIDYGGTQLRLAEVDPETGALGNEHRLASAQFSDNASLTAAVSELLPAGAKVGISAAGDVDEQGLVIRYSPNATIDGPITLGADLAAAGHEVAVLNDIAAATQGEAWYGAKGSYRNKAIAVATYSTGFNWAFAENGVVSSRRSEVGHSLYGLQLGLRCGCGGIDHLESYVSGSGAAAMARLLVEPRPIEHRLWQRALDLHEKATGLRPDTAALAADGNLRDAVLGNLGAVDVYAAVRAAPFEQPQQRIREEQCRAIASSLSLMVGLYNPLDAIILMGSQTKDWDLLFEPAINEAFSVGIMPGLQHPEIKSADLAEPGVQGAVAWLLARNQG